MGYTNKLSCQCGYEVTINIGSGRQLPDVAYVKKHFPEGLLSEFNAAWNAGCLSPLFYIESNMYYCKHCRNLKEGSALHFQINDREKTVYESCPGCGREMKPAVGDPSCPQCGKELTVKTTGYWD